MIFAKLAGEIKMVAVTEKTNRYINKKESKRLQVLYSIASRTIVMTTTAGIIDKRKENYHKLFLFWVELSEKYELPLEKDGAQLKIGPGNELVYALVN